MKLAAESFVHRNERQWVAHIEPEVRQKYQENVSSNHCKYYSFFIKAK
jgi:hypothetical protein